MAYPTEFDGKFRVVPNGCRTLKPDTYVNDDGSIAPSIVDGLFTGLLLDVRDIERDILSQAIGPAFDSLVGAQSFAEERASAYPGARYMIVKGLISVEWVVNREYEAEESRRADIQSTRDEIRHSIIFFVIAVTISALILFLQTPTPWASNSLIVCAGLSLASVILFRGSPTFVVPVISPICTAIFSAIIYGELH